MELIAVTTIPNEAAHVDHEQEGGILPRQLAEALHEELRLAVRQRPLIAEHRESKSGVGVDPSRGRPGLEGGVRERTHWKLGRRRPRSGTGKIRQNRQAQVKKREEKAR